MFDLDTKPLSLLTTGNPKTAKGEGAGYLTAILHFAPHKLSGANVCAYASAGCIAACLNTAGRGGIGLDSNGLNMIQAARIRRTRYFTRDRAAFMADLACEIAAHERRALAHGLKPAVRLNGTSDLPWENIRAGAHANIFAMFPTITFYDYTKVPARIRRNVSKVPNYTLSFSLSESNDANARDALAAGLNVVAVFDVRKSGALPARFMGRPVIDGDKTDLRFLDPSNVIVGLRAKGRGKRDESGFVRHVDESAAIV
jgi:hypothetical protein